MVKASGLAAGKGVVVVETREEACAAVDTILGDKKYGQAGSTIVVEEKLTGEEVSVCIFFHIIHPRFIQHSLLNYPNIF